MNSADNWWSRVVALGLSLALLHAGDGAGRPRRRTSGACRARAGRPPPAAPQGGGGRGNFVPEPVPPAQQFKTSTEHYAFLMRLHKGGTRHTYDTVPKWEGLWSAAGNTATTFFLKGGGGRRRDRPGRADAGV